jgi:hypothetical protein
LYIFDRYDYNKYLQMAAADRIDREGLNNARQVHQNIVLNVWLLSDKKKFITVKAEVKKLEIYY